MYFIPGDFFTHLTEINVKYTDRDVKYFMRVRGNFQFEPTDQGKPGIVMFKTPVSFFIPYNPIYSKN